MKTLFTQMYPISWKHATKDAHGFLMVDLKQQTPNNNRLVGNYCTDEMLVYMPKNEAT